jgi:hypothetical protein
VNDRTDIEFAWSRITVRSDRFGIGFFWGGRYVRSDKTETMIEVSKKTRDEKEFSAVNQWMLGSLGIFMSTRFLREWPLSFFTSGSVSVGAISGMAKDSGDEVWDDGVISTDYHSKAMPAWALTGTLGLQYPVTEHGVIRLSYRAQGLNSIDGFWPFIKAGTFFDGQGGVGAGVSILF